MTPGQLRSGAQFRSFHTQTQERLEGAEHPNKTSNMIDVPMNGSTRSTTIPLVPEEWFVTLLIIVLPLSHS